MRRKTLLSLNETIAVAHTIPETHPSVLFPRRERDETSEGCKQISPASIASVPDAGAAYFINALIEAEHLHRRIRCGVFDFKEHGKDEKSRPEAADGMADTLGITDFSRDWLQTIIILNEAGAVDLSIGSHRLLVIGHI
jgi:hypothetical protein